MSAKPITQLPASSGGKLTDEYVMVDVTDHSQAPTGTDFKISGQQVVDFVKEYIEPLPEIVTYQTGGAYTYQTTDWQTHVVRSNGGGSLIDTIPQAGSSGFPDGYFVYVYNADPSSLLVITSTSCTINGINDITIEPGAWAKIISDGTNYVGEAGLNTYEVMAIPFGNGADFLTSNPSNFYYDNANTNFIASPSSTVSGTNVSLIGGSGNTISGLYSFEGGGLSNTVSGEAAGAIGGLDNNVSGSGSVASGGALHTLQGSTSFIGGGESHSINSSSTNSAIIGGESNTITNQLCAIVGGGVNSISSETSFIGGGDHNTISSSGICNVILGGEQNTISGSCSDACIVSGYQSQVTGTYSFAGGSYAHANTLGTFVWSDNSTPGTPFASSVNNSFIVQAAGGMGINQSAPDASAALDIVSTTRGALFPRMTTTERNAISSPATSLFIYNTTSTEFEYYNGSSWVGVGASSSGVTSFNTRTGAVTLTSTDVTTALGYTPLNPANDLSDVSSASSSRTNLGLGTAAVCNTGNTVISVSGNLECASPLNNQTAMTSYTYATSDRGKTVNRSNSGTAMTDTLPQAGSSFPAAWFTWVQNSDSSATLTITPTTSTINSASTLVIGAGGAARIVSDGTNYWAEVINGTSYITVSSARTGGSAPGLPVLPVGYIKFTNASGTNLYVPYYS